MESNSQKRVHKLVLTGGPCGGKTTGQSRLSTFFENLGWKVFRVPETATVLLSGGIKFSDLNADEGGPRSSAEAEAHLCARCAPSSVCPAFSESSEAFNFQENLLKTMIQIENTFSELGNSCQRDCLIICDRGAMDASAFISKEKWDLLISRNNWNNVELRDNRYNHIVHMVSAANGAEHFYSTEDHICRSEGVELARELDTNAAAAWIGHPYFDVIDNSTDFESKIKRMIACICQKVGIDTGDRLLCNSRKLKFLVTGPLPNDSEFPPFQDFDVVHYYLQSNGRKMQARLRKRGQKNHWSYIHTIRRPQLMGQSVEVKTQLTHREYVNMQAQRDDYHFAIHKKRRCFIINNQYYQLDIYQEPGHPRCRGLMLLETYSAHEKQQLLCLLPQFLKIEKEVTGNPDYSMFNLSLREDWKTSNQFCRGLMPSNDKDDNTSKNNCYVNGTSSTNGEEAANIHSSPTKKTPNCAFSDNQNLDDKAFEPKTNGISGNRLTSENSSQNKSNGVHSNGVKRSINGKV